MEEKKNNAVEKVENVAGESCIKQNDREEKERCMAEKRIALAREKIKLKEKKEEKKLYKKRQKEQKKAKKNNGEKPENGGWLAAVITLGVSTLVLASALTFTFLMPSENDTALEATYQKSFYDTVDRVDNIDVNLSKIFASKDRGAIQIYLTDVAINSELAENDLQQLPIEDQSKFYTTKLVNQIGDYAKYLNKKLVNGENFTEKDVADLVSLYEANKSFKASLITMTQKMGNDFSFSSLADGNDGNVVISGFNELQNLSVNYPELIYDGPFSDGINQREIKGISGNEISKAEAEERFAEIFSGYGIEKIKAVGENENGIKCYNVTAEKDGEELFAQISKQGENLIMFDMSGSCKDVNIEGARAREVASEFIEGLGIAGMKPVWSNLSNNVYTINFAFDLNGVVVYSDMIKIRVCAETSMVIGFESSSYYTNHTERKISTPALSKEQAKSFVSENIEIETARLALVPVGTSSEVLCYEFSGNYDESQYFVYIDAKTGRQVEMFKVTESTEGTLLI